VRTIVESVKLVNSVASARRTDLPKGELVLKRVFDLTVSVCAFVCIMPVLLLAMIAIVLESPGSPIFTQIRVGQNGKLFRIFKLRTMVQGSDAANFRTQQCDARLTRVGIILRRLNIDELPQLLNVMLGDMSIIGPRPLSLTETEFLTAQTGFSREYAGLIPAFRPGLVGLEQVNRFRDLTYAERFKYNNVYETGWTLASDIQILLKAVCICSPVVFCVVLGAIVTATFCLHIH
jgi:lipopolysaccharide/colanic/teichoic acid biosynthesis glycosyltransferase